MSRFAALLALLLLPACAKPTEVAQGSYLVTVGSLKRVTHDDQAKPLLGRTLRLDLLSGSGAAGEVVAVLSLPGTEPVALLRDADGSLVPRAMLFAPSDDTFDFIGHVTLTTDGDGRVTAGSLSGDTVFMWGDVGTPDAFSATLTITRDTAAPTWTVAGVPTFGDRALPWETAALTPSEPVEPAITDPTIAAGLGTLTRRVTAPVWPDEPRVVGFEARLGDWSRPLSVSVPSSRDFAGNLAAPTTIDLIPWALPRATSAGFDLSGDAAPATWGAAKKRASCPDAGACWAIPYAWDGSPCVPSAGGLAFRLPAGARVQAHVRAISTRTFASASTAGGPKGLLRIDLARPGGVPVSTTRSLTGTLTGDTFDTGWQEIAATPSATGREIGVAIGVAAFGPYRTGDCHTYPSDERWTGELLVDRVEALP
jgi:hypothetical protein